MSKKAIVIMLIVAALAGAILIGASSKMKSTKSASAKNTKSVTVKSKLTPEELKTRREVNKHIMLGMQKMAKKDYQGAYDECSKALKVDRKNPDAYICRSRVRARLKDFTNAMKEVELGLKLNPDNKRLLLQQKTLQKYAK